MALPKWDNLSEERKEVVLETLITGRITDERLKKVCHGECSKFCDVWFGKYDELGHSLSPAALGELERIKACIK